MCAPPRLTSQPARRHASTPPVSDWWRRCAGTARRASAVSSRSSVSGRRDAFNRAFNAKTGNDPAVFGDYPLFRLDVTGVTFVSVAPEGDAMVIEHWRPGAEVSVIRRT